MASIKYQFKYMPLVGKLPGKAMAEQTEQAINEIAEIVNDNTAQAEIINTLAEEANANSVEALEKATEALETSGRVYITKPNAVNLNDFCESELLYIGSTNSTNLPVASKGFLEVKTNDDKTEATQVFVADSNAKVYTRSGAITAQTVGDVTTYTASYGSWVQIATKADLTDYLPLTGGTMSGTVEESVTDPTERVPFVVKYTDITDGVAPAVSKNGYVLEIQDSAGTSLGGIFKGIYASGVSSLQFVNKNSNGDAFFALESGDAKYLTPGTDLDIDLGYISGSTYRRWKKLYVGEIDASSNISCSTGYTYDYNQFKCDYAIGGGGRNLMIFQASVADDCGIAFELSYVTNVAGQGNCYGIIRCFNHGLNTFQVTGIGSSALSTKLYALIENDVLTLYYKMAGYEKAFWDFRYLSYHGGAVKYAKITRTGIPSVVSEVPSGAIPVTVV